MNHIILMTLLSVLLLNPKKELANSILENLQVQKDTIEFSPNWDFKGDCAGLCNVYVGGTNTINKVNGILINDSENVEIFVKCPTKIRLKKDLHYKFIAEKFVLDSCTTIIDTMENTRRFRLIEQIK